MENENESLWRRLALSGWLGYRAKLAALAGDDFSIWKPPERKPARRIKPLHEEWKQNQTNDETGE